MITIFVIFVISLSTGATPILQHDIFPQPVIIDTDIGSYMDDPVAIMLALSLPSLDVKLITTASGDTTGRAVITAKILTMLGRDDIPIGIGVPYPNATNHTFWNWARDFNIKNYKGKIYHDGVAAMADVILKSEDVVDIICIGPMTNFPDLLRRFPNVTRNARIKAMAGSFHKGYGNSSGPCAETNVKYCPECFNEVLRANWTSTIVMTPVDTSEIELKTPLMEFLLSCDTKESLLIADMLEIYCIIQPFGPTLCRLNHKNRSPYLFDPVCVLLATSFADSSFIFDSIDIIANSTGYIINSVNGTKVDVAMEWKPNALLTFMTKMVCSLCGFIIEEDCINEHYRL